MYKHTVRNCTYSFSDLKTWLAKATPYRSGDALAGLCAESYEERIDAQMCLANVLRTTFIMDERGNQTDNHLFHKKLIQNFIK